MGKEKAGMTHPEINPKTQVVSLDNLGFSSYDRILFQDLNLNIRMGEVTAVTGRSGSGKTVLLKILAGRESEQEGKVFENPKVKKVFIPQELQDMDVDKNLTIRQILKDSRGLSEVEQEMAIYENKLANQEYDDNDLENYGEIMEVFQTLGGYTMDSDMEKVLSGLGLDQKTTINISLDTRLGDVSSGQLRKIMIATALYSKAGLILLDEPTSHLDVKSVDWLAEFLRHTESAAVIASNNAEFIDKCATQTVGLTDIGRVFVFEGGYSEFVRKRDTLIDAEKIEAQQVASKLEQLQKTDAMFRSKQVYKRSSDMAQVGRALKTRMGRLKDEYESLPGSKHVYKEEKIRDLAFSQENRSGKDVISLNNISKRYDNFTAFNLVNKNIAIQQGEKWLFWGPNGSGKSTLVRTIVESINGGIFLPEEGKIKVGAGIKLGYYTPEVPSDILPGILIDSLANSGQAKNKGSAASILRFFGFSSNAIHKQDTRTLSSGEKKRFALARIMINHPNFIVLDEPTGDFMSEEIKERLANALDSFDGTFVLVSHDVDFIKRLKINKELGMPDGKVTIRN